mgnify:CR=1 FL=1
MRFPICNSDSGVISPSTVRTRSPVKGGSGGVDNVFAHTPEGAGFRLVVEPLPPDEVRLSVEDSGGGFPAGQMLAREAL